MEKKKRLFNEIPFDRVEISEAYKYSSRFIAESKVEAAQENDDFLKEMITIKVSSYIYENKAEERELVYYCDRPKFFDWLFRRRKKATFNLKVKDILIDPPKTDRSDRIYVTTLKKQDS